MAIPGWQYQLELSVCPRGLRPVLYAGRGSPFSEPPLKRRVKLLRRNRDVWVCPPSREVFWTWPSSDLGQPWDNPRCPPALFHARVFLHMGHSLCLDENMLCKKVLFTSPLRMCKPTTTDRSQMPLSCSLGPWSGPCQQAHLPRETPSSKCSWHHLQGVPTQPWNRWPPWKRSLQLWPPGWIPLMGGPCGLKTDLIHITGSWLAPHSWGSGGF